jgi:hypothetical protein
MKSQPFDLRTKITNSKQQVLADQPYTLFVDNGIKMFERPPQSGQFFYEDGSTVPDADKPAGAVKAKEEAPAKVTREQKKAFIKKAEAHSKDESNKHTPEELTEDEDAALKALLKED